MKEKLIELLGLKADASDDAVVAAVAKLQSAAAMQSAKDAGEKEITSLIQKSGGALNRQSAIQVLNDRKARAKASKK